MEKYFHFDRNKSIQELDKINCIKPNYGSSLVSKCYELIKVPISTLTVENLRLLIGQEICLNYLVPLAIEALNDNIFTEGDLYCGDLLDSVLKVDKSFWQDNTCLSE